MKPISLVITDLDNTLWDWFEIWHSNFAPLLAELEKVTKIPRQQLVAEIKTIHQRHHTSEYSFVLQELPCLKAKLGRDVKARDDFPTVIQAAQEGRAPSMIPYPGVIVTLKALKRRGIRVVGFTESQLYYTTQRLKALNMDGLIDALYATPDQLGVDEAELKEARQHPSEFYKLQFTQVRPLPDRLLKPNTEILFKILEEEQCSPQDAVYVGDSLTKDIQMAKGAGVFAVHAKYGVSHDDPRYSLLREVTHWTQADVEREKSITHDHVLPDAVLNTGFAELIPKLEDRLPNRPSDEDLVQEIGIWKETLETQRHFNDLQIRLRTALVTLLTAVIGAIGYSMSSPRSISLGLFDTTLATAVAVAGLVGLVALYFYEHGYHQLLIGAVRCGMKTEDRLRIRYPSIALAHEISLSSHQKRFLGFKLGSDARRRAFYLVIGGFLAILAVTAHFQEIPRPSSAYPASTSALESYYTSRHSIGVEQVCELAKVKLLETLKSENPDKYVAVLDIDETALSTWPLLTQGQFEWNPDAFAKFVQAGNAHPIPAVLALYRDVVSAGVPVVFLSSRSEGHRKATEENLKAAGYAKFERVFLKPEGEKRSTREFKQAIRDSIRQSRTIILNLGDQMTDLDLPPSDTDYLVPNPFYTSK